MILLKYWVKNVHICTTYMMIITMVELDSSQTLRNDM